MISLLLLLACSRAPTEPPNLLIVVADDLGVDNVSSYGVDPRSAHTPVIDSLANDGVRFRNAWAYPECSPTRAALMTGRYGRRNGVGQRIGNARVSRPFTLPLDERTLPEVLGRPSSAVGKWHLTNDNSEGAQTAVLDAGFDWFAGSIGNLDAKGPRSGNYRRWEKVTSTGRVQSTTYATVDTTNDAILRATQMPEPWLLYVAYAAPHPPYHVPPAHLVDGPVPRTPSAMYRAAVEAMDHELGRLLASLPADVRKRTTVVVLGDNGTPRDAVLPPQLPERAKNSLFEGGIRVPLVVSGARVGSRGAWSDALVHVVDLLPTAAELAGVPSPDDIDGVSLVPALSNPDWSGRDLLYAEMFAFNGPPPWFRDVRALRDQRHKLIRWSDGRERLYDLHASGHPLLEGEDLLEQQSLTPAQEAALVRLRAGMDRHAAEITYSY